MPSLEEVFTALDQDADNIEARLIDWLKIPSISTDPAYAKDCLAAAEWAKTELEAIGIPTELRDTGGHPAVVGKLSNGAPGSPTVLMYGHYDVQPAEPLELWHSPAFEPTVRDGAVYARGASDDKGLALALVEGLRATKEVYGEIPLNLIVLLEGEEECGSANLGPFLEKNKDEFKCDIAVVADTNMWGMNPPRPAITTALKGLLYMEVKLHGANSDLHSGMYGGIAPNPLNELTQLLGQFINADRQVTLPGFYDDVAPITEEQKAKWTTLGFSEKEIKEAIAVDALPGEKGFTPMERNWARPTCDINGIYGGYMGEGAKTVLPNMAGVKISFRLCANQNPEKIKADFIQWFEDRTPPGCRFEFNDFGVAEPVMLEEDSIYMDAARRAFEQGHGEGPVLVRDGATIPVIAEFKSILGVDSLCMGYRLDDDNLHAPNEKLTWWCLHKGAKTSAALIQELAALKV